MTWTINNQTIVHCFFFFCFSAFIAYLFRRSNLFFKSVLFIPFISMFAVLEGANRLDVSLSAILGIVVIFFDSILNFLYYIKLWIENTFYGFFSMIRRILQLIFFPIADFLTWFYNLLSRTFGWNRVFHKLGRPREEIYTHQKADRPRQDKQKYQQNESFRKPEPGRDRAQRRNTKHQDKGEQRTPSQDKSQNTQERQNRSKDDSEQRKARPDQSQSSRNGKTDYRSDKKPNSDKKVSPEEQARQDAINKAREEVKRAREQAKRKEDQQDDNNGGGGRSYQQILGLSDNYSLADLMKAYKLAVSRYHPDKYSHMTESFQKEAQAEFVKVKKAYNELVKNFN